MRGGTSFDKNRMMTGYVSRPLQTKYVCASFLVFLQFRYLGVQAIAIAKRGRTAACFFGKDSSIFDDTFGERVKFSSIEDIKATCWRTDATTRDGALCLSGADTNASSLAS